jgi:hypothetical protein
MDSESVGGGSRFGHDGRGKGGSVFTLFIP